MGRIENSNAKRMSFPGTDWQQLERLKAAEEPEQHLLLNLLAERYWTPIFLFLLNQGCREHEAKDLAQDFFAFALECRLFSKADRARGRFRSFLLASLKHFVAKTRRREQAGKRCPPGGLASLDAVLEEVYLQPPALVHQDTPESRFHQAWLRELLANVLTNLECEFAATGKATHFELFRARVVAPELEGMAPPPLEQQARELGLSFKEAANRVTTAKRAFKRMLAREIRAYALSETDSQEEFQEVLHLLKIDA